MSNNPVRVMVILSGSSQVRTPLTDISKVNEF